jgi:hypothetical protein
MTKQFKIRVRRIAKATCRKVGRGHVEYKPTLWRVELAPGVITYVYAATREEVLTRFGAAA